MLSATGSLLKAGQQQAGLLLPALQTAARQFSSREPITGVQSRPKCSYRSVVSHGRPGHVLPLI